MALTRPDASCKLCSAVFREMRAWTASADSYESGASDALAKSPKSPPPRRGRVRAGVVSDRIPMGDFPLPLIPSRLGRGKFTFREVVISEYQRICQRR